MAQHIVECNMRVGSMINPDFRPFLSDLDLPNNTEIVIKITGVIMMMSVNHHDKLIEQARTTLNELYPNTTWTIAPSLSFTPLGPDD